jgi:dTDP-4-amino-4,6-dideoxygalactose transaminase
MEEADNITRRRLAIWTRYHQAFENAERRGMLRRPMVPQECTHNAHMYYLLLPDLASRSQFIAKLREAGIHCVFHYTPLHSSPMGAKIGRSHGDLKLTTSLSNRLVRLPLWLGLEERQGVVIEQALEAL